MPISRRRGFTAVGWGATLPKRRAGPTRHMGQYRSGYADASCCNGDPGRVAPRPTADNGATFDGGVTLEQHPVRHRTRMPIIPMPISRRRGFTAVGWGATLPAFGVRRHGIRHPGVLHPASRRAGRRAGDPLPAAAPPGSVGHARLMHCLRPQKTRLSAGFSWQPGRARLYGPRAYAQPNSSNRRRIRYAQPPAAGIVRIQAQTMRSITPKRSERGFLA